MVLVQDLYPGHGCIVVAGVVTRVATALAVVVNCARAVGTFRAGDNEADRRDEAEHRTVRGLR